MAYNVPNNIKDIPDKLKTLKSGTIEGVDPSNSQVKNLRSQLSDTLNQGYGEISNKLDAMISNADTGNLINTPELQTPPLNPNGTMNFVNDEKVTEIALNAMQTAVNTVKSSIFAISNGELNVGQSLWTTASDVIKDEAKKQLNNAFDQATEEMFTQFDEYIGKGSSITAIGQKYNSQITDKGMEDAIGKALKAQEATDPGSTANADAKKIADQAKQVKKKDDIMGKKTALQAEKQTGSLKVALINLAVDLVFDYYFGQPISTTTGEVPGSATTIFSGLVGPYGDMATQIGDAVNNADITKITGRLNNCTQFIGNLQAGTDTIEKSLNAIDGIKPETASKVAKSATQIMNKGVSTEGGADIVQKAAKKIALDITQANNFTAKA